MSAPQSPEQLRARGEALMRERRFDEAIAVHEQLLALRPASPDSWFNLGWMLRRQRRYQAALDAYGAALAAGVRGREEVHLNRAVILSEHLERVDEAARELEQALAAAPSFVPAWLNLGNLREDRGDADGARLAYARALAIDPGCGRAHARLAAIDVHRGEAGPAALRLEAAAPGLHGEDRAEVLFALGNALDAAGRYDEAWTALAQANALAKSLLPPGARYDRAAAAASIDRIIAAFPAATPAPQRESGGNPPIFICGLFRSGSTLAEQILARHSAVTPGGELETLPALVAERLQPYPAAVATADVAGLAARYLDEVRALHPQAERLTDKRCDNFLHLGLIKAMFPAARIVHTRRDPLDTLVSTWSLYFGEAVGYGFDLEDIAHWTGQYRRLMAHWQRLYGDDIFHLDYEAVTGSPRATIERLLDFCGLSWEEACLSDATARRPVRTASVWQVRQPLHRRSVGRWRNYARQLEGVRTRLA